AARRVPRGGRAAAALSLGGRARPPVGRAGRPDRAFAGRLRAGVLHRPRDHGRARARHPPGRRGTRALDTRTGPSGRCSRRSYPPEAVASSAAAASARASRAPPHPTRPGGGDAAATRAALWANGLAPKGQGDLLRAPYSFSLAQTGRPDRLRARGIPAVSWGAAGTLLVGAFETPDQASLAEAQLRRARVPATLVTRTRTKP